MRGRQRLGGCGTREREVSPTARSVKQSVIYTARSVQLTAIHRWKCEARRGAWHFGCRQASARPKVANNQLQEAVTAANDTSNSFSDEVLKEHEIFELSKQQEMKELLKRYADGQVEMLQRAMDDWDRVG